jgi:glycosyltransferase involved in cell wall biosynthesis
MTNIPRFLAKPKLKSTDATLSSGPAVATSSPKTANKARDQGDWSTAAYHYGQVLTKDPKNGGLYLQLGHMLKELGLHWKAAECYLKATALMPDDPEPYVQRAILAKFMGEFGNAQQLFQEAGSRGYKDTQFLSDELRFLEQTDGQRIATKLSDSMPPQPFRIYLSSIMGAPRPDTSAGLADVLGAAHYSYSFIVAGYMQALDELEIYYELILNPEYIPDIRSRSSSDVNIHIGFYPPSEPRILKGAYNIFVVAWEFERLPTAEDINSHHAFSDPSRMLSLADEIWSISEYGSEAIRKSVTVPVHTVPTPVISNIQTKYRTGRPDSVKIHRLAAQLEQIQWIPLAIFPQILAPLLHEAERRRKPLSLLLGERSDAGDPVFFLSIMNVNDFRKQIKPAIEAFILFSKEHENAFMLLKLTISNKGAASANEHLFRAQIADAGEIAPPYISDRIWITATILSRQDLVNLYDITSFYISVPHGEGQNLPLIEAMARGVVPISVNNTAMRDFINDGNAILVTSKSAPFNVRLADRYKMSRVNTFYVSSREVYVRLKEAMALEQDVYVKKSKACIETVKTEFGIDGFVKAVTRVVSAAQPIKNVAE